LSSRRVPRRIAPAFQPKEAEGDCDASGLRFTVLCARWNPTITQALLAIALETLERHGAKGSDVLVVRVPGAFELPGAARAALSRGRSDALVVLGAIVRGQTTHHEVLGHAVAAALAALAGGYAFGHSKARRAAFVTQHAVPMHGAPNTLGLIRLGARDDAGNWPMLVEVTGLPQQPNRRAYYELWLTRNDKPVVPCGAFRVHEKTTRVRFTVPYALKGYDGWVVTAQPAHVHTPGRVVLTTT